MYFAGIFSDPVLHFHHSHALPKQFFMLEAVIEDAFHKTSFEQAESGSIFFRLTHPPG